MRSLDRIIDDCKGQKHTPACTLDQVFDRVREQTLMNKVRGLPLWVGEVTIFTTRQIELKFLEKVK